MSRSRRALESRESLVTVVAMAALVVFFLATTAPHIGDHPIIGGDEGWIISASAKLARNGVFGSDLFTGFYGADRHYYFNLPLFHLVLAGVFKVFGSGLTEARLTTVTFGLATLGLTYALGRRTGGAWVALAAAALLVLLRLNLAPFTGLTLTDLGATVRYDLPAVPFALVAALLLLAAARPAPPRSISVEGPALGDTSIREALTVNPAPGQEDLPTTRSPAFVVLAGFVLGLGCLVQFIDALMLLPLALFVLTLALPLRRRLAWIGVFLAAAVLPCLPYLAYVTADWHDFRGQSRSFEQRSDVLSPAFYLDNLRHELDRYDVALDLDATASLSELIERPSARLVFVVVGPLALAYLFLRSRHSSARRLLALVLAALVLEFAFLESTKLFVYWVIAVPFLCIAISDGAAGLLAWRPASPALRRIVVAAVIAVGCLFALEGVSVGIKNVRDASEAADYSRAADEVMKVIPAGSTVVADNRMWLGLQELKARSLLLLFYWTNPRIAGEELTDVEGAMTRIDADYVLLSPLTKEILSKLTPSDSSRFARYMDEHATLIARVAGPPYGPIEVYRLR